MNTKEFLEQEWKDWCFNHKSLIGRDCDIDVISAWWIVKMVEHSKEYENKMGEACVALAKILVAKQYTEITDDEVKISAMYLEGKRKQDEINYIQYLRNQIEELKEKAWKYDQLSK
jgi:hypothetical protein